MKILKEVENVIWVDSNRWAVVGKGSGQVHAVFAEKLDAELFCDAIEVHGDGIDCGYEIFRVEGSIDR